MATIRFTTNEFCFPIWGSLAMEMAKEAGFEGIEITDGGGYLQPHPMNNGYVEYERFGLDLRRKDSFPLTDPYVQNAYLEAAAKVGIEITGIYLYLLDYQSFAKAEDGSPQADQCYETIEKAVISASQMGIPQVTVPLNGAFGIGQHTYAYRKLEFAVKKGEEYGVRILVNTDTPLSRQIEITDALSGKVKIDFRSVDPEWYGHGSAASFILGLGKERIGQVRMKDMKVDSEGFVTKATSKAALLGQGDTAFRACIAAIRDIGYEGWVLAETPYYRDGLNGGPMDYVEAAAEDIRTLQEAFGQG